MFDSDEETMVGAAGAPWTPLNIATIDAWCDFSAIAGLWQDSAKTIPIVNNAGIEIAEDMSAKDHPLTQNILSRKPLWRSASVNGLGSAEFDGSDDFLLADNCFGSAACTFFYVVADWNSGGSIRPIFSFSSPFTGLVTPHITANTYNNFGSPPRMIRHESPGAGSTMLFWENGTSYSPYSSPALSAYQYVLGISSYTNVASQTSKPMAAGAWTSAYRGKMRLCEMFMIREAVSLDDRQKAEGYLAHKWGLTASLPIDHPYKSSAP